GYLGMLGLMEDAGLVVTDSGGIQEESAALGVPCLTLRDSTRRPSTIAEGTDTLMPDRSCALILDAAQRARGKSGRVPAMWDGHTAERIVDVLRTRLGNAPAQHAEAALLHAGSAAG